MKMLDLELKDYIRLRVRSIKRFKLTPKVSTQLLLGSNGSGKSSILTEITPLPADHKQYGVGGFKKITWSHNNRIYTLVSDFSNGARHSFLLGDEELNTGGTVSVQRDLVKQHFGITPEIHELLLGERLFTEMSPMERRKWFTMLSETSYDYALALFNRVSQLQRDLTGALRQTKARLVMESSKLISESELRARQQEVTELQEELNNLLEQRIPVVTSSKESGVELTTLLSDIEQLATKIIKGKFCLKYLENADGIEQTVALYETELQQQLAKDAFQDGVLSGLWNEQQNLQKSIDAMEQTGSRGVVELTNQLIQLEADENALKAKLKLDIVIGNPMAASDALTAVKEALVDLCLNMPSNEEETYTRDALNAINEALSTGQAKLEQMQRREYEINSDISHMESHRDRGSLNCPNCSHNWTPGFELAILNDKLKDKESVQAAIAEQKQKLMDIAKDKTRYDNYIAQFKDVRSIVTNTPSLKEFWKSIEQENLIKRSPRTIVTRLESLENDLLLHSQMSSLKHRQDETRRLIALAHEAGDLSLAELKIKSEELQDKLFIAGQTKQETKKTISNIKSSISQWSDFASDTEWLKTLMIAAGTLRDKHLENMRREMFNELVNKLQSQLAAKETAVRQLLDQQSVIDDIQRQVIELTEKEKAAKLAVTELSPNDGLIAEGMIGFINAFIKQMNIFIRKVWMYPLVIQPCKMEEDSTVDLDYKFPMCVNNDALDIPDVSKGSRSIEEIINLAFRLTAMQYLDLGSAPVVLDEFASSFDEAHRTSAMEVIRSIMERQSFSQLFMVNHYESTYGSLVNAQVTVICSENITLPKDMVYNQYAEIDTE